MKAQCPFCGESVVILIDEGGILAPYATCSKCDAEGPYAPGCKESEVIAAFTQPAHALRAALARAERAEARMDALRGWLVDHECKNDRCPFCRTLDLIAELEKP